MNYNTHLPETDAYWQAYKLANNNPQLLNTLLINVKAEIEKNRVKIGETLSSRNDDISEYRALWNHLQSQGELDRENEIYKLLEHLALHHRNYHAQREIMISQWDKPVFTPWVNRNFLEQMQGLSLEELMAHEEEIRHRIFQGKLNIDANEAWV